MDGFPEIFEEMDRRQARWLRRAGIVLCAIGVLGIAAPKFLSVAVSLVIALMLILLGIVSCLYTHMTGQRGKMPWIKALSPLLLGLFIAIKPFALIVVLGLAIFVYFVLEGMTSLTLAMELKPWPGWRLLFLNGTFSLCLAGLFILFWPYSTHWYLGWMVGLSLIANGIILMAVAKGAADGPPKGV